MNNRQNARVPEFTDGFSPLTQTYTHQTYERRGTDNRVASAGHSGVNGHTLIVDVVPYEKP